MMLITAPGELKFLGLAVLIGLVHLVWAAMAARAQQGLAWAAGPRDEPRPVTGMAARLERAFANYRETFPLFAALVLANSLAGHHGALTVWASATYVIARALYIPLYAYGVRTVRSLVWAVSFIAIIVLLVDLFA